MTVPSMRQQVQHVISRTGQNRWFPPLFNLAVAQICSLLFIGIKVEIWAYLLNFMYLRSEREAGKKMRFSLALKWLKCTTRISVLWLNETSNISRGASFWCARAWSQAEQPSLTNVLLHLSDWRKQDGTDSKISAALEPQLLQPTLPPSTSPVQKVGGSWGDGSLVLCPLTFSIGPPSDPPLCKVCWMSVLTSLHLLLSWCV